MAEVTGLRNNALPYPVYGAPYGVVFPMLDADGDLVTGATTPDAERSLNGDTFADCTNESVEIATNSGMYYLLLTAAEMSADVVAVIAKSATAGMKTTALVLYPRKMFQLRTGTAQGGAASSITLDSGASPVDDIYNNCLMVAVIDGVTEVRMVTDYVGSTKVATCHGAWVTATPDADDTFGVYVPEGRHVLEANVVAYAGATAVTSAGRPEVNVSHWLGTAAATPTVAGVPEVDVTHWGGTAIATAVILAAANIASDAITAAKIATSAITNSKFAAGALDAAALAADAGTEIATAVWAATTRLLTAGTNIVLAKGTEVTGFNDLDAAGVRTAVGLASANLDTQLGDLPTNAELATSQAAADDATLAAIPSAAAVADAVWDELTADHAGAGSMGVALSAAGGSGDPWATALPGAYGSGTAGKIIGDNINATVGSRATQTSVDDVPTNAELTTALGTADDATLSAIDALPTATENADALLDRAAGIETNRTLRQAMRLMLAAMVGKASGLAGTTATYRDTNDGVDRIVATVDTSGNRSAVTLDAS